MGTNHGLVVASFASAQRYAPPAARLVLNRQAFVACVAHEGVHLTPVPDRRRHARLALAFTPEEAAGGPVRAAAVGGGGGPLLAVVWPDARRYAVYQLVAGSGGGPELRLVDGGAGLDAAWGAARVSGGQLHAKLAVVSCPPVPGWL